MTPARLARELDAMPARLRPARSRWREARARTRSCDAAERLADACVEARGGRRMNDRMGRMRTIHFVGIGGAGMGGIAEVLLNLGYAVRGLGPASRPPSTERLRLLGARGARGSRGRESRRRPTSSSSRARWRADNPEVLGGARAPHSGRAARRDAGRADALPLRHRHRGHARQDDDDEPDRERARGRRRGSHVRDRRPPRERQRQREARRAASIWSPRPTRATRRSCICSR